MLTISGHYGDTQLTLEDDDFLASRTTEPAYPQNQPSAGRSRSGLKAANVRELDRGVKCTVTVIPPELNALSP
jgi:hypothetical protein